MMLYEKGKYILERTGKNNNKTYYRGAGSWTWSKDTEKAYIFDSINSALNALEFYKWLSKEKNQTMYYEVVKI